jgi:hypothetical protein
MISGEKPHVGIGVFGRLRELVLGSPRRDALGALQRAGFASWTVSGDGRQVELAQSSARITLTPRASENEVWIAATVASGSFSLPRGHWIASQLERRLSQRLAAYRRALEPQARKLLHSLCSEVPHGGTRRWSRQAPSAISGCRADVLGMVFFCDVGGGFVAAVSREVFAGSVSLEAAFSDMRRYDGEIKNRAELAQRDSSYSWGQPVSPPVRPGPFRFEEVRLAIFSLSLSRLLIALRSPDDALASCSAECGGGSEIEAIWRQAVESGSLG